MEENKEILEIIPEEIEEYLRNFEIENKFDWLFKQSQYLIKNSKHQHALIANNLLMEIQPDFPPAYTQTASSLLKLNKLHEVLEFIDESEGKFVPKKHHQRHFLYIKAKALYDLGRNSEAESLLFKNIEEYDKKPPWFNFLEILILEKAGKFSQAINLLEKKIEYYGKDDFYLQKKLDFLNQTGEKKRSYEFLEEVLELQPHNIELLFQKGMMDYDKNEFESSKHSFNSIIEIKEDYRAHLWLCNIFNIEKKKDLANKHIQRAFELAESDEDRFHCLNMIMDSDSESTIDAFVSLWLNKPMVSPKHLYYISKLRIKHSRFDEAEDLLHRALNLEKNQSYYLDLARIASAKKEYAKADNILIRYGLMDDIKLGYLARNEYCHNAVRNGQFLIALQRFNDFSGFYPEDFQIKSMIVNLYNQLSRYQDVIDYLDKEIRANPDNDEAWRVLIRSYYQQQNYFKVISLINQYNEKFGKHESIFADHANSLREVGRYEKSHEIIDEGLLIYPESYLLKMSKAQLYRRLSSEFFFDRSSYHEKALKTHESIKCSKRHQIRSLRNEIIVDLINLKRFSDALTQIDQFLTENPGDTRLINMKIRVYSKMGNHTKALEYIESLPENIQTAHEILTEKAAELLYLDKWDKCDKLLKRILNESQTYQAFILKIRLEIRRGKFKKAKETIRKLIRFSPHHAFVLPEILDFALTDPLLVHELYDHLGLDYQHLVNVLTFIEAKGFINETPGETIYDFKNLVTLSQIVLEGESPNFSGIEYSTDGKKWRDIQSGIFKVRYEPQGVILTGYFPLYFIKIPSEFQDKVRFGSMYALPTSYYQKSDIGHSFAGVSFTTNIVETGLGDQLHYIRTASILAESLGFEFEGFLKSELEIIRDRVTSDPGLYKDLGFKQIEIKNGKFQIVKVPLSLQTRFVPAVHQWPTFETFLSHIKDLIEDQLSVVERNPEKKLLVFLSIDDHNITRLISKLYYPDFEPSSQMLGKLKAVFYVEQQKRMNAEKLRDRVTVLLQCRLGDVANVPFIYKDEDIWVIPFNGEVLKANDTNKHHMRYDNLETIKQIGLYLRQKYPDQINLKLITDGYDYGIEYLKDYQKLLVEELGANEDSLNELKKKLADDFYKEFDFVDEVVYGESYENLIKSIDLITNSNVLISTNGQFTNEFKMSFAKEDEEYMIVKKLYSNLRVKKSPKSKEMFWEIEGQNMDSLLDKISAFIEMKINS